MGKTIKVGDKATKTRTFGPAEVRTYADLSGDDNPVHLDEAYAKTTPFGGCICHGMLVASGFSALLGAELPGPGTIYLGQTFSFKRPVMVGEEVTLSVEVTKIRDDKPILTMKTLAVNSKGEVAIEGEATVKYDALVRG
jgi:enoyl-CoA hydratase